MFSGFGSIPTSRKETSRYRDALLANNVSVITDTLLANIEIRFPAEKFIEIYPTMACVALMKFPVITICFGVS